MRKPVERRTADDVGGLEPSGERSGRGSGRMLSKFMAHVCAFALLLIFGTCFGLLLPYMPAIEGFARPVITADLEDKPPVTRTADRICWSFRVTKHHEGLPIIYQYAAEVRQAQHWLAPSDINAHLATTNDRPAPDDFENHEVGESWPRRWCALMSHDVPSTSAVRITGFAKHHAHPIWDTYSPMPAFEVLGLPE